METTDKKKNNGGSINEFLMKLGVLGELLAFLWKRKLYWLIPMIVVLLLFAAIIALGAVSGGGLFVYTLF
jgi:glycerol uptake facilitator-like aquaporin